MNRKPIVVLILVLSPILFFSVLLIVGSATSEFYAITFAEQTAPRIKTFSLNQAVPHTKIEFGYWRSLWRFDVVLNESSSSAVNVRFSSPFTPMNFSLTPGDSESFSTWIGRMGDVVDWVWFDISLVSNETASGRITATCLRNPNIDYTFFTLLIFSVVTGVIVFVVLIIAGIFFFGISVFRGAIENE